MRVYLTNTYQKIFLHIKEDGKDTVKIISAADYINNVVSSVAKPFYSDKVISVYIYLVRLYLSYLLSLNDSNIVFENTEKNLRYKTNSVIYLKIKKLTDSVSEKYFIADEMPYNFDKFTDDDLEVFRNYVINEAYKGIDPEEILCNYFSDIRQIRIYCTDTEDLSFPLQYGFTGYEVKLTRKYLSEISSVIPSLPNIQYSDDLYGIDTVTAVKCFQNIYEYDRTGETSRILFDRLSYMSQRITAFFEQITSLKNIYEKKSEDICDREINSAVMSVVELNSDIFDATYSFKERFCRYYHLLTDDRYGIIEKLKKIWTVVSELIPGYILYGYAQPFSGKQIFYGDSSAEVTKLQSYIKTLYQYVPQTGSIHVSGKFDDEMISAIKKYQKKYGIESDGMVGMFTWNGISDLYNYFQNTLAINDKKCYNNLKY